MNKAASVQAPQVTDKHQDDSARPRALYNAISTMLIIQQFFSGEQ
jgi:hypothetical protein